jgi:TP901 family phage tail tape measure protein
MASTTLEVIFKGRDGGLGNMAQGLGGKLAGAGKMIGTAAIAGTAAAGAAIIGFGALSIREFAGFERQMNEVFTLMPGISDKAMGEMSDQVLGFSRTFGTLPSEVIPALYQSLSAGVPPGNVFDFMEVAQKAAIGGITELETAVDGITSVVNAYGEDVIGAAQASDLMFTAVRLGKTDFDQLSRSLFNVIPTASALGVEFGDVTAGLAALTAQGVPTSVATTQMRQLFVELSKEGGAASKTFQEMAGVTFKDFIREGGNTADALEIMLAGANELGIGVNDLFSSVEAGSAALSLAGSDVFIENINEMANATGATEAAFDQMDQGILRSMDRFKAFASTTLIEVGDAMAPVINEFLSLAEGAMPAVSDFITNTLVPTMSVAMTWLGNNLPGAIQLLSDYWTNVLKPAIETVWAFLNASAIPYLQNVVIPFLQVFVPAALQFLSDVWENVLLPAIKVVWAWMENTLMPFLQDTVFPWLQEKIPAALQTLSDFWENTLLPAIEAVWGFLSEDMMPIWEALEDLLGVVVPLALEVLQGVWENVLLPAMEDVWEFLTENLGPAFEWLKDKVLGPVTGSFEGLGGKIQDVAGFITGLADKLRDISLPGWMTPGSPTPWEIGLRGVRDELESLYRGDLPLLNTQLQGLQATAQRTTNVNQVTNIYTSRVDTRGESDASMRFALGGI